MNIKDESGGVVKIILILVVVGVVIFDAGSVAVNFFGLDSTADDIATEVSTGVKFEGTATEQALEREAKTLAEEAGAKLVKFDVGNDKIIRLTLRREANTLLVGRVDAIKDWGRATSDGQAGLP